MKGQKRKLKEDSRKDNGKGKKSKKGEFTSTVALERNELYFNEDKAQEMYNIDFSIRNVSNGRWVNYNVFVCYNFELSIKLGNLG